VEIANGDGAIEHAETRLNRETADVVRRMAGCKLKKARRFIAGVKRLRSQFLDKSSLTSGSGDSA
jgi:hypothetical protein